MVYCFDNNITNINVSNNANLEELSCGDNALTGTLDLSNNPNFYFINYSNNLISNISLSSSTNALEELVCNGIQLTSLNLSNFPNLGYLACGQNSLTHLNIKNGNNLNFTLFNALNNPSLSCIEVDDPSYSSSATATWQKDAMASYSLNCGTVGVVDLISSKLSIYPNPSAGQFLIQFEENELKQINVYSQTTTRSSHVLDLDEAGIYSVEVISATGYSHQKIIRL